MKRHAACLLVTTLMAATSAPPAAAAKPDGDDSPSILARVGSVVSGHWRNRGGPTTTHRRELEIASQAYELLAPRLRRLVETELPAIELELAEAGAPWTPGRRPLP